MAAFKAAWGSASHDPQVRDLQFPSSRSHSPTGAAVRLHRNAVRDRPESLSAFTGTHTVLGRVRFPARHARAAWHQRYGARGHRACGRKGQAPDLRNNSFGSVSQNRRSNSICLSRNNGYIVGPWDENRTQSPTILSNRNDSSKPPKMLRRTMKRRWTRRSREPLRERKAHVINNLVRGNC